MSAAAPQIFSAAPQYNYVTQGAAAPQVTYLTQPAPTYVTSQPAAQPVMYAAAPTGYTYAPQAGAAMPMEPQMAGAAAYYMPQQAAYGVPAPAPAAAEYAALPAAASMVAYPGMSQLYYPTSVQAAWDNHFSAFGDSNLEKIMLDYDETSIVRHFNKTTGEKKEFRGTGQIREMFASLFADLSDKSTLKAPVIDVEEEPKQVFLVWECPGCGYNTAADTFLFGPDFKIKRQNIIVATGPSSAPRTAAAGGSSAKATSGNASKDAKKTTTSKKKKNKGCC